MEENQAPIQVAAASLAAFCARARGSGGLREETPSLGKPVLVLCDVAERPEGVGAGTVRVVGVKRENIVGETVRLLEDRAAYAAMASAVNPYGDGKASQRIVQALLDPDPAPWA